MIPDTDNVEVAMIAAALQIAQGNTGGRNEFKSHLIRFVQAYDFIRRTVQSEGGAVSIIGQLEQITDDGLGRTS